MHRGIKDKRYGNASKQCTYLQVFVPHRKIIESSYVILTAYFVDPVFNAVETRA